MTQLAIYGSGGLARELAWQVGAMPGGWQVLCFIDDDATRVGTTVSGIEVWSFEGVLRRAPHARIALGIGAVRAREQLSAKIDAAGLSYASLIHSSVLIAPTVRIGAAPVICLGTTLTTDIVLGAHVQINPGCTIAHDVEMEDFATLAPGVHISGNVVLRRGAYLGTGAVVINGTPAKKIVIGAGAVVGAGACVTKDVPAGVTVVGVPARPLER